MDCACVFTLLFVHFTVLSGTEQEHVVKDYARMLHIGQVGCTELMGQAINDFATKGPATLDLEYCEYLNISVCNTSETDSVPCLACVCVCMLQC